MTVNECFVIRRKQGRKPQASIACHPGATLSGEAVIFEIGENAATRGSEFRSCAGSPACVLTVVAIFQDEARNLDEWLAFCLLEGVERVLLYNHCSTDGWHEVLRPWIETGFVELIDWQVGWKERAQIRAYQDALQRLRGRTKWAAFIDIDEFLFSPSGSSLPEVLGRYDAHAGVIVNWQCYGTSGRTTRPTGLTIESYTRRARTGWARNRRVKTIVDPELATEPFGPHLFRVVAGSSLVTEDFRPVRLVRAKRWRRALRGIAARFPYLPVDPYSHKEPSVRQVSVSTLRINHYATRSGEDLLLKYKDRHSMSPRARRAHARYHDRNEVEDPILAEKAGRVREIIDSVRSLCCVTPQGKLSA